MELTDEEYSNSPDDIEDDWDLIEGNPEETKNKPDGRAKRVTRSSSGRKPPFFEVVLKNKMMCSLYNLYSRFPTEPPIFRDDTIWILGQKYELTEKEKIKGKHTKSGQYHHANTFIRDVHEKFIWFTYRQDFPVIQEYNSTSDIGWGCMLRTGQMMLAKVLLSLVFSPDWRLTIDQKQQPYCAYRQILRWFSDIQKTSSPYSIHNLITNNTTIYGHTSEKRDNGGEWFSPSKIAHILEHIISAEHPSGLVMYVPMDGIIYIDQILRICTSVPENISRIVPHESVPIHKNPNSKVRKNPLPSSAILASFIPINETYNFYNTSEKLMEEQFPEQQSRNIYSDIPEKKPSKFNIYPPIGDDPHDLIERASLLPTQQNIPAKKNSDYSDPSSLYPPLSEETGFFPHEDENPESENPIDCEKWNPLFIIIPSRIGVEKMNRAYVPHINYILKSRFSVGIIGGKPRASLYFIGFQGNNLIYLDPHIVQESIHEGQIIDNEAIETYHCKVPLKMSITSIDPSMAIGFFCKTQEDFFEFMAWHGQFETSGNPTIFSLAQKSPSYVNTTKSESSSQALSGSFVQINK